MAYILSNVTIAQPFTSKLSRYGIHHREDLPNHGYGKGACDIVISSTGRISSITPTSLPHLPGAAGQQSTPGEGMSDPTLVAGGGEYQEVSLDRSRVTLDSPGAPGTAAAAAAASTTTTTTTTTTPSTTGGAGHPPPPTPADLSRFSFPNCFAWPGLIDSSVHTLPPILNASGDGTRLTGLLHLSHGITSVRETGVCSEASASQLAVGVALGNTLGPRHFWVGRRVGGATPSSSSSSSTSSFFSMPSWLTSGAEEERAGESVAASTSGGGLWH